MRNKTKCPGIKNVYKESKFISGKHRYMLLNDDDQILFSKYIGDDLVPLYRDSKWAILPEHLQQYDFVYEIKNNVYIIEKCGLVGIANLDHIIIDCCYHLISDNICNERVLVFKEKLPFLLDLHQLSETPLPEKTKECTYYSDIAILIKEDSGYRIINRECTPVMTLTDNKLNALNIISDNDNNSIIVNGQRYDLQGRKVMLNENELILLDNKYDACGDFHDGLARVRKKEEPSGHLYTRTNKFSIKDRRRKHPDQFGNMDAAYLRSETEYEKSKRRWGFINIHGEEVIRCKFYHAEDFSEGLAIACYTPDWKGYINTSGDFIIARKYRACTSFSEGIAFVGYQDCSEVIPLPGHNNLSEAIDAQGKTLFNFDEVYNDCGVYPSKMFSFKNGYARFMYNSRNSIFFGLHGIEKYGFIDKSGKVIFNELKFAYDYTNGHIDIKIGDQLYPMSINGEVLISDSQNSIEIQYELIRDFESVKIINNETIAHYGKIWNDDYGYSEIIYDNKSIINSCYFKSIEDSPTSNCFLVSTFNSQHILKLSHNGFFIIDCNGTSNELKKKYRWLEPVDIDTIAFVAEPIACFKKGLIDAYGNEVIPCIYDEIEIDHVKQIIKCRINDIDYFSFENDTYNAFFDYSFNQIILDQTGNKTILKDRFDLTREFGKTGLAAVYKNKRWGFVDKSGELVIPCTYLEVNDFEENSCTVRSETEGLISIYYKEK